MSRRTLPAFTLIELLVVVAIIALLISILLPSLAGAREQGKRAKCLTNMRSIAQGSHGYSTEDRREHAVPIHKMTVSQKHGDGFSGQEWGWRTAVPFNYGGQTATRKMPLTGGSQADVLTKANGDWAAATRPLNAYIYGGDVYRGDDGGLRVYQCPSDQGFPENSALQDAPDEAARIPCYEMLGNSYRVNYAGFLWPSGGHSNGFFSCSPWGHKMSSLINTSRTAMYCEPMFYNFSRQEVSGWDPDHIRVAGWHRQIMTDNVGMADGSGRSIKVDRLAVIDSDLATQMNMTKNVPAWYVMRHGKTWQTTNSHPVVGAFVRVKNSAGTAFLMNQIPSGYKGWPCDRYQSLIEIE